MSDFKNQYGPWALVAGGAQGIGEAYSRELARRGLNVAIIDVSKDALDTFVPALATEFGVDLLPDGSFAPSSEYESQVFPDGSFGSGTESGYQILPDGSFGQGGGEGYRGYPDGSFSPNNE